MESVVAQRTDLIRLVIDSVHQPHNISACLRSCEAFGIQNVHIVGNQPFKVSGVSRGSAQWLSIHRHKTPSECISLLKQQGFTIACGMPPHKADSNLNAIAKESFPIAVVFGNEHSGLGEEWLREVDLRFCISMVGFVESLNISVSAAVTLFQLRSQAESAFPLSRLLLDTSEQAKILDNWAEKAYRPS